MRWSIARPGRVLLVWALLLAAAGVGVARLEIDTSTDSILDRGDPAYAFHRFSQELFGGEEILVAAIEAERPFDPPALAELVRLSDALEQLPDVRRVDSLSTVPLIRASSGGGLDLRAALDAGIPGDEAERERLARDVLADRVAPGSLVSRDGRVFAVNLLLDKDTRGRFLEIVDLARAELGPGRGWLSGVPVFRTEINVRTRQEILLFAPITVLIMSALLFAIFRSAHAVLMPLATGAVGAFSMLGAMGAAGVSITLLTMTLPTIMLAFGTAYSMHVLALTHGARTRAEMNAALLRVSLPLALSGLTTAIGFLSIAAVRIDAVREVGIFGAIGVLAVTAASLTLLPACLRLGRIGGPTPWLSGWLSQRLAAALVAQVSRRPSAWIACWLGVALLLAAGLFRLDVQTDATNWFPPGTRARDDYDAIRNRLAGISPVNVVISAGSRERVTEPDMLAAIDALSQHLEALPSVGKAVSIADPLRQIHGGFSDDPALPLPAERALAEQYLVLLESVEPIWDLVTPDRSRANVMLRVDDNQSGSLLAVAREAERWWQREGPAGSEARGTGTMFEFARAEDEMSRGQLRGLGLALAALMLILLAVFRSPALAGIALLPNLLPIMAAFGAMGLLGVALDAGTVIVGSLALGMAVDDTMHVLTAFQEARERGEPSRRAIGSALAETLPAVTYTSLVVALGFGVLGLSGFTFIRNLGLIIAGIMLVCWLADVHLLPALVARRAESSTNHGTPGIVPQ